MLGHSPSIAGYVVIIESLGAVPSHCGRIQLRFVSRRQVSNRRALLPRAQRLVAAGWRKHERAGEE